MKKKEIIEKWYSRALSNLKIAKLKNVSESIFLEDLCFNAQQAAEKSLKALCIKYDIEFPKTHNIMFLFELLQNSGVIIPEYIKNGVILNEYAVESRYPGDYYPVQETDYYEAVLLAEKIVNWVKELLEECKNE